MRRIGIDAGGTFTDAVFWDEETGLLGSAKVSSTKADPAIAVVLAAQKVTAGHSTDDLRDLVHGTTVATNAALERTGPRIAILTTAGFRDVLEIGRLARPPELLYDLLAAGPRPLAARRDRFEVRERLNTSGEPLTALDEGSVVEAAKRIRSRHISSVAICFLYSFLNPEHELRAAEILKQEVPGIRVSISSEIFPQMREFERSATTALNAYLTPVVAPYLERLQSRIDAWHPGLRTWIMQSNGGVASTSTAAAKPVKLLLSGPSGGAVAGRWIATQVQEPNTITMDMGGTSFDVCVLADQQIPLAHERLVMEMPIQIPAVDIATIGTGGGSIAEVDTGGAFTVGPASAGAEPGPACYGRGGVAPTVTDANLVLGYLSDKQLLGGEVQLDKDAAMRSCERLGRKLGLSIFETAIGIRKISNAAMAGGVRTVSVGKGRDPRGFSLTAFGGAGPMHAVDIASDLSIPRIIVPPVAGCQSALGLVVSDVVHDYAKTVMLLTEPTTVVTVARMIGELAAVAVRDLADEGIDESMRNLVPALDMRYYGQYSTVTVPISHLENHVWLATAVKDFHRMHEKLNGFKVESERVEIVTARLVAIGTVSVQTFAPPIRTASASVRANGSREIVSSAYEVTLAPLYLRDSLTAGQEISGPAVVESDDTTIVLPPKSRARIDVFRNLRITLGG